MFTSETTKKALEEQKFELLRCCARVRNCGRSSLNCFALFSQFKGEKIFNAPFICCFMFSLRSNFSGFLAPLNCKKSRFPHTSCTHTCIYTSIHARNQNKQIQISVTCKSCLEPLSLGLLV